jgi:hypothetical protein
LKIDYVKIVYYKIIEFLVVVIIVVRLYLVILRLPFGFVCMHSVSEAADGAFSSTETDGTEKVL